MADLNRASAINTLRTKLQNANGHSIYAAAIIIICAVDGHSQPTYTYNGIVDFNEMSTNVANGQLF